MTNTILPSWGETPDIQRAIPIAMKANPHRWMFFIVPRLLWQVDYFIQTPHVIGDASFHCRSYAQRLMNPAEVVVHEIERQRVLVIFQLF